MNNLTIKRLETGSQGTFGALIHNHMPFALTLERQWLDNASNVSCIPEGEYLCKRVNSPRFGDTFEVSDVSGRSHILFHKGNLDDDSHGCILVGESFGRLGSDSGILGSKGGYSEFMHLLKGEDSFSLTIINCYGV
ncbi:MAG: hypothetical protein IZT57_03725 [Chloroflexi bacterium]|nr:hypothetical protein [Chloroflexota bacterium]